MPRVLFIVAALVALAAAASLTWITCCSAPGEPAPRAAATTPARSADAPSPRPSPRGAAPADTPPPAAAPAKRLRPTAAAPEAPAVPTAPETPSYATLRITADVPGAQVFLNREFVGAAPAVARDLKPGSYQLNVSASGYDNHVETIELAPGEREVSITFREVRLDASLEVVHKHRFGACRGRLVATPKGLRYETSDKDDAFAAGLTDLETFQVDYLNKNLRIQPRKGKRYDFTDPEGNADRLFVFHRDVDRARERLKKDGAGI